MSHPEMLPQAAATLRERLGDLRPAIGIVLGSGLGHLAGRIHPGLRIPYGDLPGFPPATVPGHRGEFVAGHWAGKAVIAQSGRVHGYEGHSAATAAFGIRLWCMLGVQAIIFTNAAGGIHPGLRPGQLMLIADHLNLTFRSPLTGAPRAGEKRFPDMSEAYDARLRELTRSVARQERIALAEGVYAAVPGPSYETPSEIRMLDRLGADAVGMSTVLEVVAARAWGVRCLGLSLITNMAAGIGGKPLSHEEVLARAEQAGDELGRLLEGVVRGAPV